MLVAPTGACKCLDQQTFVTEGVIDDPLNLGDASLEFISFHHLLPSGSISYAYMQYAEKILSDYFVFVLLYTFWALLSSVIEIGENDYNCLHRCGSLGTF